MGKIERKLFIIIAIFFILSNCILITTYATEETEKAKNDETVTAQATVGTKYQIKDEETWDISKNGKKNVIAKWTLKDKTLRISGKGDMKDWDYYETEKKNDWHETQYQNIIEKVIIENGVTNIGYAAFEECINLKTIIIPESVVFIGSNELRRYTTEEFYGCKNLKELQVDSNNKKYVSIDGVLYNKSKTVILKYPPKKERTKYVIPNTVKKIEGFAFEYCSNLTSIVIPNSVTNIEERAFYSNSSLKSIEIPTSVKNIKQYTFYGCSNLSNIIIPNTVTNIGEGAFKNCSNLKSIKIPNSVNTIRRETFEECSSLTSITIPNSVTSILCYAFCGCTSLTDITIPRNLVTIDYGSFKNCTSLKSIKISSSVKKIDKYAFHNCRNLTNINIPNTVKSIDSEAFCGCKGPILCKTNSIAHKYAENNKVAYRLLDNVASQFGTKYQIKDREIIDISMFQDKSITAEFSWNDKTLKISGKGTVRDCYLWENECSKYVHLVENISIGYDVVDDLYLGRNIEWYNLKKIKVSINNKIYADVDGVLFNKAKTELIRYPASKTQKSYSIPSSVKIIKAGAFFESKNLTSVLMTDSVLSIEEYAFSDCVNLGNIKLSRNITNIGYYAFADCWSIKKIEMPKSVRSLGEGSFYMCRNLTEISLSSKLTKIESMTLCDCSSLTSITIPNNVKSIGEKAFEGCENLKSIIIPKNTSSVDVGAFSYCYNLRKVIIVNSSIKLAEPVGMEVEVFEECPSLIICKINSNAHKYAENKEIGYFLDGEGPVATFNPTTFSTPKKSTSVKVTVSDAKSKVVTSSLKYLWSKKTTVKATEIKTSFKSGDKISSPKNVTGKYYLYIYAEDVLGNKKITKSKEINLDNTVPKVTSVKYSTTKKTNKEVTITVTANEQIQTVSGWILSKDKKVLTKTYKTNGTEKITIKDIAGNSITQTIKVANIDKTAPKLTVSYSTTEATKGNVVVTLTSNEEIKEVANWKISKDKKTIKRTYTKNTEETLKIYDIVGNKKEQKIKISNIDKTIPKATVKYSKTTKTNQNVVVTVTANEVVQAIKGWSLSKDSKTLTKTYTKNFEETIEVKDKVGNVTKKKVKITNIDKVAPTLKVTYSTKELTSNSVKATITSNEQIRQIKGWSISKDGKILSKTYIKNTNENIQVYDIAGNETKVNIKIENIDKTAIDVEIEYSKTELTNENVEVTVKANKELLNIEGWSISESKLELKKTYTENKTEEILLKDIYGNERKVTIEVNNIDKISPKLTVSQSEESITTKPILVIISADELIQEVEGWDLGEDGKTLTKTYKQNTNEDIEVYDLAGNKQIANINIQNILEKENEEGLDLDIKYSTTEMTNKDVEVEIIANKELQVVDGWTLSTDKKSLKRKYIKNAKETITVKDTSGNEEKVELEIDNIDKVAPKLTVRQSEENITTKPILVTISADELIQEVEGWNLGEDGKTLTKEYKENTKEEVTIKDIAGNETKQEIKIENIEEGKEQEEQEKGDVNQNNQIDIGDILLLIRHMAQANNNDVSTKYPEWKLSEEKIKIGDVNKNNKIDIGDILKMQRYIASQNDKNIANKHPDWLNL